METEPKKAYVYQPLPANAPGGKCYGVGGLVNFGLDFEEAKIQGITKNDAEEIVNFVNESPEFAASFIRRINKVIKSK